MEGIISNCDETLNKLNKLAYQKKMNQQEFLELVNHKIEHQNIISRV